MSTDLVGLVNQLRATLGKMEVVLGAIKDAIVWTGKDGKVQWCNAAFDRLVNQSHITVLDVELSKLLPLMQNGKAIELQDYPNIKVLSGEYAATEYEFQQDDRCLSLEISGNSVELTDNEQVAVLVIRDITEAKRLAEERQQTQQALRRSEARYRAFVTATAQAVWLTNAAGEVIEDIPLWCALTGRSEASAKGWGWLESVHPDDREPTKQVWLEAINTGKLYEVEQRVQVASGEYRLFIVRGVPILDEQGNIREWIGTQTDITERKQAEAALRRSNAILKAQQEASIDGILVIDEGQDVVSFNQRFCQLWNIPGCVIQQQSSRVLFNTMIQQLAQPQEFLEKVEYLYAHPEEVSRDEIFMRDGRILEHYSAAVQSSSGEHYGRIWYFRDISKRKQAEAALRQREQEFRALVENAPDVIIRFDRHSRYLYINSRVERVSKIPPAAYIGKTPREIGFPDAIADYWQSSIDVVFKTAQEMELEFELELDGQQTYQSSRIVPEFNHENGSVESVLVVCRDITDRKQSEEALHRRAQQDSLLSQISRQFIDQDLETAITFSLRAVAEFLKTERCRIYVYSESQNQSYMTHEWCKAGVEPLLEMQVIPVDQAPWLYSHILYNAQPLVVSQLGDLPPEAFAETAGLESVGIQSIAIVPMIHCDKVVGFIGTDRVSSTKTWSQEEINLIRLVGELIAIGQARHAAEAALRIAKEAAESANRAKSTFLANMSHELRTPLNAILGFAQLMERSGDLTAQQQDFLSTINRSGEHLLTLINDVLEMSKIEAGRIALHPVPCDLYCFLHAIEDMVQVRAEAKALTLQVELASNLPQYILVDEGKLRQVLINLLGNAIKFTDAGGVRLRVLLVPNKLHFEIHDTGRGIAADELHQLFQPFVQTASGIQVSEGTGLGLTISRQFVQLMGGEIQVNSTVGLGSTFSFEIPVELTVPFESVPSKLHRRVLKLAPNQPVYRLLIVDDRAENNELLAHLLNSVGFETRLATNGQDAIAQWQIWQPHLIWMDMRMPVMDGYEATEQIRLLEPIRKTKIIALTASAFEEQRSRILAVGCDDMVRKPFQEHIIFDKLTEHLGVQFLYAESQPPQQAAGRQKNAEIDPAFLQVMPIEWIAALHQAAIEVDTDLISQLIDQITESHTELARGLMNLSNRFCFDEILELTQTILDL
jgi:two-component system sensor histidine kinase/response regulator